MAAFLLVAGGAIARGDVALRLRIPPAETYVIGDAIPLGWEFRNQTTQALGFMWEGCCRINGKLDVTAVGGEVPVLPAVTALAHMFAKADRLDPGRPREYETKVGDWVVLPQTGTYELRGTYRGVLPTQFPQVQRGLALWRTAAVSDPIRLEVLGVEDYLGQREDRIRRRALRVTLQGPEALPPLDPVGYRVVIENLGDEAQPLRWPDDEALWVLDGAGVRVAPAAVIGGATEELTVPSRGRIERTFTLSSDRFEGEALGHYRLFVDLAEAGPGRPRVPSNVVPLSWQLSPAQVRDLVESAAKGAGTGARNAPLKLLRVYLEPLADTLASLDRSALSAAGRGLAERLTLAGRLKPIQPKPGQAELRVEVPPSGQALWTTPGVAAAAGGDVVEGLREVLDVRRHLGWEVQVAVEPRPETPVVRVAEWVQSLAPLVAELAAPPSALVPTGGTNAPVRLQWAPVTGITGPVLRIDVSELRWTADGATRPVADTAGLDRLLEGVRAAGSRIRLAVAPGVSWRRVAEVLARVGKPGEVWLVGSS